MDNLCVLIPAHNEELLLGQCIESALCAIKNPENIYVVDDASSDKTFETAQKYGVNILRNEINLGKAASIKRALDEFRIEEKYEFVALLDADSQVAGSYDSVINIFKKDGGVVVVCGQVKSLCHNWITAHRAFSYFIAQKIYKRGQSKLGVITVAPGCATVYRSNILSKLKWEADTLVEDMDLTVQIHRAKIGQLVYCESLITQTQDPKTLKSYIGQMNRWFTGTWQIVRKYKIPFGFQRIDAELALLLGEGITFSLLVILLPLFAVFFTSAFWIAFTVDQLVLIAVALWASFREKRGDLLKFFPLFIILRAIDCFISLTTFYSVIIRKKRNGSQGWFKPVRYFQKTEDTLNT